MSDRQQLLQEGRSLVISYFYPPMSVGPAFVIDALLGEFDLGQTTIFSGRPERSTTTQDLTGSSRDDVRRFDVPSWWPDEDNEMRLAGRRVPIRLRTLGNILVALRVVSQAVRVLRQSETRVFLVVYPKQSFLLAGCIASLFTRKPMVVYFLDVYVEGLPHGRRVASLIERYALRRAYAVFAMSEPHRQHIERKMQKYGVKRLRAVELPHPYREPRVSAEQVTLHGRLSILFSGAIYAAQADAVRRLIDALYLPQLAEFEAHLTLYTQTPVDELARWGIAPGPKVTVRVASHAETRAAQRSADILFLPIAFDSKDWVRRTASPSKLPEYLAAETSILVHAPPDAYVTRYAEQLGFAQVVKDPDADALAHSVRILATDDARRAELRSGAARTLERHHVAAVAGAMRRILNEAAEASAPGGFRG